jgi:hypothetical protein
MDSAACLLVPTLRSLLASITRNVSSVVPFTGVINDAGVLLYRALVLLSASATTSEQPLREINGELISCCSLGQISVPAVTQYQAVSVGPLTTCSVLTNGNLECSGDNRSADEP